MERQSLIIFGGIMCSLKQFISHLNLKDDEIKKLFTACAENNEPEIMRLIENGVDVNYKTKNGYTPLLFEIKRFHRKNNNIIELLLKRGADINVIDDDNGYNSLIYACENDDIELVKLLVNYGIDINFQNIEEGTTALMVAYINSYYDIAHFLLENGANPNIQNYFGYTALMYLLDDYEFVIEVNIEVIKMLIEFGANINIQDRKGNTALMQYVDNYAGCDEDDSGDDISNIYEIFKYLITCGYNFDITNNAGNNLLICANSDINFMKLILDYMEQH